MNNIKQTSSTLEELTIRLLEGRITESEAAGLHAQLKKSEENLREFYQIQSIWQQTGGMGHPQVFDARQDLPQLLHRINPERNRKRLRTFVFRYAAIVLVVVASGFYLSRLLLPQQEKAPQMAINLPEPGSSKARLILPDGEIIALDTANTSAITGKNFSSEGGKLTYREEAAGGVRLHKLLVPRGGEYEVQLSDGSRVWLNAETELIYPESFSGNNRKVLLKGEAYFEVTADSSRPFTVVCNDMEVSVLGTAFNMYAYPGEMRQTTLINGKVNVTYKETELTLSPGEQANETATGLSVSRINTTHFPGWKNNRFVYRDKPLEDVFRELSRWYDVSVTFKDEYIRKQLLTANLPRYEEINKVAGIIEEATGIKVEIQHELLIIRKP